MENTEEEEGGFYHEHYEQSGGLDKTGEREVAAATYCTLS